ncbi:hypothetical protein HRS9139_10047 [Pyrenophora teres f. teres]|nr:hypothetical protein HRS9139_10047 [Pyrenophora teres f. teres]
MKLCEYCAENVLQSKSSWDYHRRSWESLSGEWDIDVPSHPHGRTETTKKKEKDRCVFCWTLQQDIEKLSPLLKHEKNAWPIYRWNIRSLAKIRESLEIVVVTFRYVRPISESRNSAYTKAALPTRTFFLFPEAEMQPLPKLEDLGPSTNPEDNGGHQIRAWVQNCDTTHDNCMKRRKLTPKSKRFIPTRLLDISRESGEPIRVIETATTSVQGPYCTLSHCWGLIEFQQLRDANRERFMKEGIPWHLFTKNFQDAIKVARSLEVGYIWIDSLCIIQKSKADWDKEAGRMHLVYRNSYCNIAVVDSKDSTGGAFRNRAPKNVRPVRYMPVRDSPLFGNKEKKWIVVPEDLWERELIQSFLYVRGWVFQERMLAPRILHFAEKQIFWDCPSLSACETLPGGLPQPMDRVAGPDRHWRGRLQVSEGSDEPLAGAIDQPMESFWKTAVRKYTSCNLTNGSDKLIAMWGIAKLVRDALGVEYAEGLWQANLEDQLSWHVAECRILKRPSECPEWNLTRDIPSWSWASMDGEIVVPDRMSDKPHYRVTDHDGRPIQVNIKGRQNITQAIASRTVPKAPPAPLRVQSDSGAEIQRRNVQSRKEHGDLSGEKEFHKSVVPDKMNDDEEPKLVSQSIQIQGRVGRGKLEGNDAGDKWTLQVRGTADFEIEAFPDTVPNLRNPVDVWPYYVVLSAKQVYIQQFVLSNVKEPQHIQGRNTDRDTHRLASIDELIEAEPEEEVDYAGHGILLKPAGGNHFRRTGAFRFAHASERVFQMLQAPENCKFWLD